MKKTNFGCIQSRLDRSINTENESLKEERTLKNAILVAFLANESFLPVRFVQFFHQQPSS